MDIIKHVLRRSLKLAFVFLLANALSSPAQGGTHQPQSVKSQGQLLKLLKNHQPRYYAAFRTGLAVLANATAAPGAPASGVAFSSTLVQVAGVDEGDIVKNDASYIYQINQGRVLVIQAFPDNSPSVVNVLDFSDGSF